MAARTGAKTGLFAIISALAVVLVLLFFTPYLYHLPQAVLAVIVMMAVFGLINVRSLLRAWQIERQEAVEQIDDLLSVPGVGAALIGPNDLSMSMGLRADDMLAALEEPIQRVLDACAAPGGKTTHLAELMAEGILQDDPSGMRAELDIRDNPIPRQPVDGYASLRPYWDNITTRIDIRRIPKVVKACCCSVSRSARE